MSERTNEQAGSQQDAGASQTDNSEAGDISTKSSRAAATNRDYEDARDGKNQAHGHPREERGSGS